MPEKNRNKKEIEEAQRLAKELHIEQERLKAEAEEAKELKRYISNWEATPMSDRSRILAEARLAREINNQPLPNEEWARAHWLHCNDTAYTHADGTFVDHHYDDQGRATDKYHQKEFGWPLNYYDHHGCLIKSKGYLIQLHSDQEEIHGRILPASWLDGLNRYNNERWGPKLEESDLGR